MHSYIFYRYTEGHSVPELEIRELGALSDALVVGRGLLAEDSRRTRVEIVRGDVEVARLERQIAHT